MADFPHVKLLSATNEKLCLTHVKKLQIFNLRGVKNVQKEVLLPVPKSHGKVISKLFQTII